MTVDIDMTNPSVRRLMGSDEGRIAMPGKRREMVQLAGDAPDPTGRTNLRGLASTTRLDTSKLEVFVAYRGRMGEFDLTVDIYAIPGEPLEMHLICPRCRHQLRVTSAMKKIEFELGEQRPYTFVDGSKMPTNGGRLSVEPFQCTWEMPEANAHTPGLRSHGLTLCNLKLVIDENVAKDA